ERAGMEHARLHLQQQGLLPPSHTVARMLELLEGRVAATSGWHYIAEHVSSEGTARLDAIRRAPEVVRGVVVSATDFDKAVELLEREQFEADEPVVVATPECLEHAPTGQRLVLGPSSRAWFDRSAGRDALQNIEDRCDSIETEITKCQTLAEELSELVHKLRHFRGRFPRGWFGDQRSEVKRARAELESRTRELEAMGSMVKAAAQSRRDLERRLETLREARARREAGLQKLRHFVDEFESQAATWRQEFETLIARRDNQKEQAANLREAADELRKK